MFFHRLTGGARRKFQAMAVLGLLMSLILTVSSFAQETDLIRVGERFTYSIAVDNFSNGGFAEMSVESRGKYRGSEAFEVRFRIKTFDAVSAVLFSLNETRTSYLSAESGVPIAVKKVINADGFPFESTEIYSSRAPVGLDIAGFIFKLRQAGGQGRFRLSESGINYWVEARVGGSMKIKTEAGTFNTVESELRSDFFRKIGVSRVVVRLSEDAGRIPVQIEMMTASGPLVARLSGFRSSPVAALDESGGGQEVTPPRVPGGRPYVDNQPLGDDLPFKLGERLTLQVKEGPRPVGKILLECLERKLIEGRDALVLQATVIEAAPGGTLFSRGDIARATVNPGTLLPFSTSVNFKGSLSSVNASVKFDQQGGTANTGQGAAVSIPVGTHSLLSILYATRAFDLRQFKAAGGRVNDTRVAVFWDGQPQVFTLRPVGVQSIQLNGSTLSASSVEVQTGISALDALKMQMWFSNDNSRTPLRISVGGYTAEIVPDAPRS